MKHKKEFENELQTEYICELRAKWKARAKILSCILAVILFFSLNLVTAQIYCENNNGKEISYSKYKNEYENNPLKMYSLSLDDTKIITANNAIVSIESYNSYTSFNLPKTVILSCNYFNVYLLSLGFNAILIISITVIILLIYLIKRIVINFKKRKITYEYYGVVNNKKNDGIVRLALSHSSLNEMYELFKSVENPEYPLCKLNNFDISKKYEKSQKYENRLFNDCYTYLKSVKNSDDSDYQVIKRYCEYYYK